MTTVGRRAVIAGTLGGAALGLAGCGKPPRADLLSGSLRSIHWPGRDIHWQLTTQPADEPDPLPVVVVLHGKGGDASHAFRILHLEHHAAASRLAIASVDGGDFYWHARRAGMDTGAMVIEDFLPLVARKTGYDGPVAFLGWSMGGYGSLLLASELGPDRVSAVVAESAALWTDAGSSAPGAFDDAADFEAHDVFERTAILAQVPVRLDCGTADPFVAGNKAFAAALPSAKLTLDAGGHTADYWKSHGATQLHWIREQLDA